MDGSLLFKILIQATGLPADAVEKELLGLMAARGVSIETLTLDELREVLAAYLQDTLLEAKDASR